MSATEKTAYFTKLLQKCAKSTDYFTLYLRGGHFLHCQGVKEISSEVDVVKVHTTNSKSAAYTAHIHISDIIAISVLNKKG